MAYGYKGKGILIHTLTDGNGMPLSCCTTPANGSEREQVIPLIDSIVVKTNSPGRNSKRVKVLAADKGYDSKDLRRALRKRGIIAVARVIKTQALKYVPWHHANN